MDGEYEKVILPSGEKVKVKAIGELHLTMDSDIVRKFQGVRYIPKMMNRLI